MAKRAVFNGKQLELGLERFVLAGLASVVLLGEDALAGRDAGREVTAALSAVDVAAQSVAKLLTTR